MVADGRTEKPGRRAFRSRGEVTRDRILKLLKTRGPLSTARLARALGISAVGVRQHIERLTREGLIASRPEPGGVGRPRHVHRLTGAGHARFPETSAELATSLLACVREAFGEEGVEAVLERRTREQLALYRARIPKDGPLERRVRALARLRRDEGYLAEARRADRGAFLLVENHCPIAAAARACAGLCDQEAALFRAVLGEEATIERTEHLLEGDRRCAYRIAPRRRSSTRRFG